MKTCTWSRRIFLKADGTAVCGCAGAGPEFTLYQISARAREKYYDFLDGCVNGPTARAIRASLLAGETPLPGVCEYCRHWQESPGLEPSAPVRLTRLSQLLVQLTPACNLRCRDCESIRVDGHLVRYFDVNLWVKIYKQISARNFPVDSFVFSGGEPTLHPDLSYFVQLALDIGAVDVLTNAQTDPAKLDWMTRHNTHPLQVICGVDGASQEQYARYRRGGDFHQAISFMRRLSQFKKKQGSRNPSIQWLYLLWDYCDDDETLRRVGKIAGEIDVDSLVFVVPQPRDFLLPSGKFQGEQDIRLKIPNWKGGLKFIAAPSWPVPGRQT